MADDNKNSGIIFGNDTITQPDNEIAQKLIAQELGENIERLRKKKGMTRKQLAEKAGVSESALASYAVGYRLPSIDKIMSFALILGCSIVDLTGDNPNIKPEKEPFLWRLNRCLEIATTMGYIPYLNDKFQTVTLSLPSNYMFPEDEKTPIKPAVMSIDAFITILEQIADDATFDRQKLRKICSNYL